MKTLLSAVALLCTASLAAAQNAGECWESPSPGAMHISTHEDGYWVQSLTRLERGAVCAWTNADKTAATCNGKTNVTLDWKGDKLVYEWERGLGPITFARCNQAVN